MWTCPRCGRSFANRNQSHACGPLDLDTGDMVDRQRVAWRFAVSTPDGPHLVEQQAYYSTTDGRISWMRVLCSGFRPAPPG